MRRLALVIAGWMMLAAAPALATSTLDPAGEVGPNDFRISFMGEDGDDTFRGLTPDVAYNPADGLYLVVWSGSDDTPGEFEIYAQILASDGSPIGTNFRISDVGPDGNPFYDAEHPAVTYNPDANEFLVVWDGDRDIAQPQELEIFGQRLDGSTGAEKGANDFRISDAGTDGDTSYQAMNPDVVYNGDQEEYLVVWSGAEDDISLIAGQFEIYGQRLEGATAGEIGANDFRISDMGPDGSSAFVARDPAVAHNRDDSQYLVVWEGDDNTAPLVNDEFEIFGQRLNAVTGAEIGSDFRISRTGANGDPDHDAYDPAVAYDPANGVYLVVWEGDDDTDNEEEIHGQRLPGPASTLTRTSNFRISDMGPDGETQYRAVNPSVAFDPGEGHFIVAWQGSDDTGALVAYEFEIFAQRVVGVVGVGSNDMRISDMGPDGNDEYGAHDPAVAVNPTTGEWLFVWSGDDTMGGLVDDDHEIHGQRFEPQTLLTDATVGLVDSTQGLWRLRDSGGVVTSFYYGTPGDIPIAGDWDADGIATPGLYRQSDGYFYSRDSNTQGIADDECFAGNAEDVPVVGDWDGDGDDNLGIYRPSEQKFYLFTISCTGSPMGAAQIEFLFGNPGDKPVSGDWDGDGADEIGLHRESTGFFYWRNTLDTGIATDEIFYGDPGDRFVSGDWGVVDGVDTPAIFRPSDVTFYFRHTLTQGVADSQFTWTGAGPGWIPVSGDFGLD